jgi:hypothetical protein
LAIWVHEVRSLFVLLLSIFSPCLYNGPDPPKTWDMETAFLIFLSKFGRVHHQLIF